MAGAAGEAVELPDQEDFEAPLPSLFHHLVELRAALVRPRYLMLKRNEPYRYALPVPTQKRLGELRYAATGQRLKSERLKSIQPPRKPRSGERVESSRSLPEVYRREGLPHPKRTFTLSAGERRMLTDKRLVDFYETIQHPQRRIRRTHKAETSHTTDAAPDQPPTGGES